MSPAPSFVAADLQVCPARTNVTVGLKPDLQDLGGASPVFDTLLFEKQDGIAWVTLNRGRLGPRTEVRGITGAAQSWR